MNTFLKTLAVVIGSMLLMSCSESFEKLMQEGRYKEAEELVKKMKGAEKYDCAEALVYEYIELEEYDRAVHVYEKCTPEHCNNDQLDYPSLYCHGAGEDYELNVTAALRKAFMEVGEYDKVWEYSVWDSSDAAVTTQSAIISS